MTFLPIVERELRVTARRRSTYWRRVEVALVAILIGAVIFILNLNTPAQQVGRYIFLGLAALSIFYCLTAGRRLTADCLSEEKRDGTLGLLFLTDLKGYDVVCGKLVATSLGGFYGLLAVFPVLAVPLLLGGITNGEFWRVILVLVTTFLFSLAIGLFASALSRDARQAVAANFALLLLLTAVLPACGALVTYFSGSPPTPASAPSLLANPELLCSCPLYTFYLCSDVQYKLVPECFWWSVGAIQSLTWLLVLLASWLVPNSWQDAPTREKQSLWRQFWHAWSYGSLSQRQAFRQRLLEVNAFYWLAGRARLKPIHVWTFLGAMACWWVIGWLTSGSFWLDQAVGIMTALLLNSTLKIWIVIEAGQRLAEDRKAGALEFLLSTPLEVTEILRGQRLALRRQFLGPLLAVIGLELFFMIAFFRHSQDSQVLVVWSAGILMLLADIVALSWVAMAKALTARTHNVATFTTVSWVLFLPWLIGGVIAGIANLWSAVSIGSNWSPGWKFYLGLWLGLGLGADLLFGGWAWWMLRRHFRELVFRQIASVPSPALPEPAPGPLAGQKFNAHPAAPNPEPAAPQSAPQMRMGKNRRAIWLLAAMLLVGGGFYFHGLHSQFPPPLTVSISKRQASLRVSSTGTSALLVLPDGSLWHWGQTEGPRSPRLAVPQQIGTNYDWTQAVAINGHCVGLRRDGTIWEWGHFGGRQSSIPEPVDAGRDWIGIAVSFNESVALRRDGTLWTWNHAAVIPAGASANRRGSGLSQIGTIADWKAVCGLWTSFFGLRQDGTLWTWGQVYTYNQGLGGIIKLPVPTQVCRETNWQGIESLGFSMQAMNSSGEIWDASFAQPNPDAPVASLYRLIVSNAVSGRFAIAVCGQGKIYQLRPDGSLWEQAYSLGPASKVANDPWHRFGRRSDWVSLWSGGGTAFGLTRDGILWTWGFDPGRQPILNYSARLRLAQLKLRALLGSAPLPGLARNLATAATPPYNRDPRPLLRLVGPP